MNKQNRLIEINEKREAQLEIICIAKATLQELRIERQNVIMAEPEGTDVADR